MDMLHALTHFMRTCKNMGMDMDIFACAITRACVSYVTTLGALHLRCIAVLA
jgi:hypothetical protein